MSRRTNRREFIKTSAAVGAGFWISTRASYADESKSPNETVNFACIGIGGKGDSDSEHVGNHGNIIAICDIDDNHIKSKMTKIEKKFPKVQVFNDYREMFDKIGKDVDAVTVSTPDHHHAAASMLAIRMGKGVYCQKPLTHTVGEARALRMAAREHKVATQMGNQGTAENGLRRGVEIIRSGAIGPIREIHVWTNRPIWPQAPGVTAALPAQPVPPNVHWDLFLGPAPERPYNKGYHPFNWRGWWDYGTGALGDMGCHTANMAFMATKLEYPTSFQGEAGDLNPQTYPSWASVVYEFPARGELPPLKFYWYEGHKNGKKNLPPQALLEKIIPTPPPSTQPTKHEHLSDSGSIMVGDDGILYSPNDYGADFRLYPEEKFKDFKAPTETLPRIGGGDETHKVEWIKAIKGGPKAMSNFDYAGLLSETILLGNIAIRGEGKKLEWDGPNLKITNDDKANEWLKTKYREGWTLES